MPNPPFNAIFIESYEDVPQDDNYFLGTFLPHLKLFHYYGLIVPTFIKDYPFGAIKNLKEDDVKCQTLFEKCTMAYITNFCRNQLTFVVNSKKNPFCFLSSNPFLDFFHLLNLY
jgi:hypothetical protein